MSPPARQAVPGVLVIDKARGPSSHDVVAMVRRALRTREVGHAGTLDPMATGVLVVAVGEATKLVPYLTGAAKAYTARVELGRETDTLDATGTVTGEAEVDAQLSAELSRLGSGPTPLLEAALSRELARTSQDPPAFSAIQVDGERAYARARRGETVVLAARDVKVHALEVVAAGVAPRPWLELRVRADKGYYVRALGRDLARALGTIGSLSELRRVASGSFTEAEAVTLPMDRELLAARLVPLVDAARRALPCVTLTEAGATAARFGQRVPLDGFAEPAPQDEPLAWLDASGALVAIGRVDADGGRVLRGFATAPPASSPA